MHGHAEPLVAQQLAYTFLGKVFYEAPSEALIRPLITENLFDDWPFESDVQDVQTGLTILRDYCKSPDSEQIRPLMRDYTQLFVAPGDHFVRPWESVYLGKDHILFDRETIEVRQHYQRFGMPIPNLGLEPEDHLGLELRYIAHLCALGLVTIESDQRDLFTNASRELADFLNDHLGRWVDDCMDRVIDQAETAFYRGTAYLTRGCVAETKRLLLSWEAEAPVWTSSGLH